MNYLIEKIGLVYHSIDIYPSVFLLLFFRMLGIYIHEYLINLPANLKQCKDHYFAVIYLITKNCPPDKLNIYQLHFNHDSKNAIFLVENEFYAELFYLQSTITPVILYKKKSKKSDKIELLKNVISALSEIAKKHLSSVREKNNWHDIQNNLEQLAEIYVNHNLQALSLSGKFFYSNEQLFKRIQKQYMHLISDIFSSVRDWTNDECNLYSRFAFVNMCYELNALCKKNDEPYIYTSQHLLILCNDLIERHGESTNLLMLKGQIYEDLLKEYSYAYECYTTAYQKSKGLNVYTLYKTGMYKEKILFFWTDAIHDYQRALELYPGYYRVLYRLGACEEKLNHTQEAISVFRNIYTLLEDKIKSFCLRPMEIEYLFKISLKLASLYEYSIGDTSRSYHYYRNAEATYAFIDKSYFLQTLIGKNRAEELNNMMKEHLNIGYVREKIYWYQRNQEAVKKLLQD